IVTLAVSGKRPLNEVYDIAEDKIKSRLETMPGVAAINIIGGKKREILVELDRQRLEAYGLSVNQVTQLLAVENLDVPGGKVKQSRLEYNVRLVGKFKSLHDIEELLIPLPSGSAIRMREIARVKDTFAEVDQYARLNKETAVGILIQKQSDASIVDTAAEVRRELEQLKKSLPDDINIAVTDDRATFINNSLNDTKRTLLEGVFMTGIVLLFFLREWRSVVIVMVAIPTSIIATFMMMFFFGYTFNLLSLMGLSLCIGILVDDSIVVLENIHRHMKMGKGPFQAAIDGRGEIGMAAIAITLSDVVVFLPIAFMQGMVGQMFRQFGLTVVVATLFSLFVSFTLTPMMASRFYKRDAAGKEKPKGRANRVWVWVGVKTGRLGDRVVNFYRGLLIWSLKHRLKVLTVVLLAIFGSFTLMPAIGFEFMSKTDQGKFTVKMEMPPGTALDVTDREVARMEEKLARLPDVANCFSTVGVSGNGIFNNKSSHLAKINVVIKPKDKRERTVWEIADEVRTWQDQFPGVEVKVLETPTPGMDNFEAPIIIEVTGPDYEGLAYYAEKVRQIVAATNGVKDVNTSYEKSGQPEYQVRVNRDRSTELGFTTAEIAQALRTAMAGTEATKYKERDKEVDIRVRLSDVNRKSAEDIGNVTITNRVGQVYLLKQVADITMADGPTVIRHKNRDRMISITANYKQGTSLSSLVQVFEERFAKLNMPDEYKIGYDGDIKQMQESNIDMLYALILSLVLVYMILVILYESFLTPFIRMLALPCGIIGALGALFITGNSLNMMSIIGIIMLDGLAAKNGTLLIDYTNTLMERGMSLREALLEAGTTRLRPIF
ncbi:efflux RND transporter permease subunit, partial [bacterium]